MQETLEIKRPKLLVADDSVTIRKVVELTFAEEGVDVFAAGDGEAAMKTFVEVEPDIVLVDVNMPDPAGYQICEMIKQDETTKDIPVLLLVGSFEPFDQTEAERVGADGFLTKPFQSVRELVGRVTELLGNGHANGASAAPAPDTDDIQDLYESSFAEPYRTEESKDTVLGDAGMDDDLIETIRRDGLETGPLAAAADEDIAQPENVQGYGWMAEPAVETVEAAPPDLQPVEDLGWAGPAREESAVDVQAPPEAPRFDEADTDVLAERIDQLEPQPHFERVVDDLDDTLEVEKPAQEGADAPAIEGPRHEPEHKDAYDGRELASEREHVSQAEEFSHEPAQMELSAPAPEISELRIPEHPHEREDDPSVYIPSEEFIDIIARRVIEKLSDRAVRDIAREAVPRIAEKLIREALDPENNKRSNS